MKLKFSFFQRLIVIELLLSETIKKKRYQNHFLLELLLFTNNKSSQMKTHDDVLKSAC